MQSFRNFCFSDKFKKEIKSFHAKCESYSKKYGNFLAKDDENLRLYVAQSFGYFDFDEDKARADFANLKKEYESIFSLETNKPFEWRFEFPEVLDKNGEFMGFDLIVGNPPYIRQEEIKELKPHLQKSFSIFCGTSDIYTYFYERGHSLLKPNGILTLITSNKFCRAGYGANLRAFLLQSAILDFVDLNGVKVFDKATVDTCIVNLSKQKPTKSHTINYANPNAKDLSTLAYSQIPQDSLSGEAFIFADLPTLALKQKIEQIGTPLKEWDIEINYGIKTGYNEAFIIDTATKDRILADCDDAIKNPPPLRRGFGVGNLTEKERTAQLIKPILRGRDIKRYSYEWANLWLIGTFPALKLNIDDYPALKKYLESFMPRIAQSGEKGCRKKTSNKWFETQDNIAYYEDFEKEKISWQRVTQEPSFIIEKDFYLLDSMAFLVSDSRQKLRYLLAFLNSKAVFWYFKNIGHLYSDKGFLLSNQYVSRFPIPKITQENQNIVDKIINLVDKVLESKAQGKDSTTPCYTESLAEVSQKQKRDSSLSVKVQNDKNDNITEVKNHNKDISRSAQYDTTDLESQIDDLVYQLYELDSTEIQIIESK